MLAILIIEKERNINGGCLHNVSLETHEMSNTKLRWGWGVGTLVSWHCQPKYVNNVCSRHEDGNVHTA